MRQISNFLLLVLQWMLVFWGAFTIFIAIYTFSFEYSYFSSIPSASLGGDSYTPPIYQRLVVGIGTGFAMMGVGGILFYLRRLYLAR